MIRAIGYARVSTEEQADSGVSLAAQEAKIRAYAELYGIELVEVIIDAGESGKSLDRPGIQQALQRLDRRKADGIVISKLDRLSRNVGDWNLLITDYFGEKPGKQLWSVADSIDTRTATGRLVLNIMMTVSQWERETIGERTRDALRYKKTQHQRISGRIDYGYELADDGKTLQPCQAEQEVISTIKTLRDQKMTLTAIANELTARNIPRREGGTWEHTFIARLLSRKSA